MTVNIALNASSAIAAAFYGKDLKIESTDFFDELRESVADEIGTEVDNACIYHSDCMEIIQRYESEYGAEAEELSDCGGAEFKASEWQTAMVRYAAGIADCAIRAKVNDAIDELVESYEFLVEELPDDLELPVTMSTDCAHGWAAHARETDEGVYVWHRLDGECEARAIKAGDFWLTATWTPKSA